MLKSFEKKHLVIRTGNAVYNKDFNQNKEKPNIVKVFEYYYPDVRIKKSSRAMMSLCPLHSESNPSFAMYEETNTYYCFSCRETGDSFKLIMELENCDFKRALEIARDNNLYD